MCILCNNCAIGGRLRLSRSDMGSTRKRKVSDTLF